MAAIGISIVFRADVVADVEPLVDTLTPVIDTIRYSIKGVLGDIAIGVSVRAITSDSDQAIKSVATLAALASPDVLERALEGDTAIRAWKEKIKNDAT